MIAATPAELKWLCHTARDQPRGAVRPTVTGYDDVVRYIFCYNAEIQADFPR